MPLRRLYRIPAWLLASGAVLGTLATLPSHASATPYQLSPDARRQLVSIDLFGGRWAIVRNRDDGSVTGNVFSPDGRAPTFVWCTQTAIDDTEVSLSCLTAGSCPVGGSCSGGWQPVDNVVTLPVALFESGNPGGPSTPPTCGLHYDLQRQCAGRTVADFPKCVDYIAKNLAYLECACNRSQQCDLAMIQTQQIDNLLRYQMDALCGSGQPNDACDAYTKGNQPVFDSCPYACSP